MCCREDYTFNWAAPQLEWLGFEPGSIHVGFVVGKWRWGRFSLSTSVSSANLHSTNFSSITITYHPGLVQ
jgi:hypothetical protein